MKVKPIFKVIKLNMAYVLISSVTELLLGVFSYDIDHDGG